MAQTLTIKDMKKKFPSEWILVSDPETNKSLEISRGKVEFHSKDRDEVYREAVHRKLKKFATLYTGHIPKDAAIIL